MLAIGFGEQ